MAIALHALLVYTVVAVRRVDREKTPTDAWPILFSGGVCPGSLDGGVPDASLQTCRDQCDDSPTCDVYCHGAGGRKNDWHCLFFNKDECDSSANKGKRWRGYSCYSRPPGPVCDLESPVFVSEADSGMFLTETAIHQGTQWESWFIEASRVAKPWTLHEATDPARGFYLTSHRGGNLQSHRSECDEDGFCTKDLKMSKNRSLWETWNFIEAGDGKVYIKDFETKNRKENWLYESDMGWRDGKYVQMTTWSDDMWWRKDRRSKWTITRQDGSPACSFDVGGSLPSLAQPALEPATTAGAANVGAAIASTASAGSADSVS